VFENRVLRRIFGSKREEDAGCLRKLYNKELHNLYASPNIDELKEIEMNGTCSTHWRDDKYIKIWSENLKGRDHSTDIGIDGKVIFEWILRK
jgi:hypothetical protein